MTLGHGPSQLLSITNNTHPMLSFKGAFKMARVESLDQATYYKQNMNTRDSIVIGLKDLFLD